MEIRTNVVRLLGGRRAYKNQQDFRCFANENALSANGRKNRAKFLLMKKAVVTLLICSFRGGERQSHTTSMPFPMKDNKKETDFKASFFFANEEIEPFDAPQMCVVRRLSNAYHELKRSALPARKTEFSLKIAKLNFYKELIDRSIQTAFTPEEIVALYEEKDLAEVAWLFWNDIKCPVDDVLLLLARLACCDEISDKEFDCLV